MSGYRERVAGNRAVGVWESVASPAMINAPHKLSRGSCLIGDPIGDDGEEARAGAGAKDRAKEGRSCEAMDVSCKKAEGSESEDAK